MSKFLVTYHGSGMPDDPALMEQAQAAFGAWVAGAGDAIVDPGAPVNVVRQVTAKGRYARVVATEGATEAAKIGGYSIIQADSVDGAKAVLSSHPYVTRGGTLQVNQILEV